jgi:hypothetical protein
MRAPLGTVSHFCVAVGCRDEGVCRRAGAARGLGTHAAGSTHIEIDSYRNRFDFSLILKPIRLKIVRFDEKYYTDALILLVTIGDSALTQ